MTTSNPSTSNPPTSSPPQHSEPPPVRPDVTTLFQTLESAFSKTQLGSRWYLLTLAALVGGTEPELASQLYTYLLSKPQYHTPSSRQALIRRLREALVKLTSIIGVCKPLEAILSIMKIERPQDRDYSFSRSNWKNDAENHEKGMEWMRKVYTGDLDATLGLFDAHRDFGWISTEITYGLYLSDRQSLDDWDTEIVVLVGIAIQNLRLETFWHVRGARRIGVGMQDLKVVVECVRVVGGFMGVKLDRIPSVEEVEKDV